MAKKCKLNEESLLALFDYNSFSPSKKLEQIAKESLDRTNSLAFQEPLKMPPPLNLSALDELSAAGTAETTELPPELR